LVGGAPLQVKNTFIDMPSGLTPSHMNTATSKPIATAPAEINQAAGFMQRAIAGNVLGAAPADRSALQTPSSSSLGDVFRRANIIQSTPMATPSPTSHSKNLFHHSSNYMTSSVGPTPVGYSLPTAGLASTASRIPAPPAWNPTVSLPPSSVIAGTAAVTQPAEFRPGIPAPPAWQPNVPTVVSASGPSVAMAAPAAAPSSLLAGGYSLAPQPSDLAEEDEDADDDSDGELPPHLRNMEDAPQPPPGALHPSLGSEAHEGGTCKRCCFYPRGRCTNGYNCEFCHYEHEKRKRKNKKKKKKATVLGIVGDGTLPAMMPSIMPASTPLSTMAPMSMTMPAPMEIGDMRLTAAAPQAPVVYSTASADPVAYQQPILGTGPAPISTFSTPSIMSAPPAQPPQIQQAVPPPGFVAFTAADGRQVFVQETAPQPQASLPPLATQPMAQGPLLGAPRTAPPSLFMPDVPMPPPMDSPKLPRALGVPSVPPPMASPKITRCGNMAVSVQQAAASPAPPTYSAQPVTTNATAWLSDVGSRVWVDSATGPVLPQAYQ